MTASSADEEIQTFVKLLGVWEGFDIDGWETGQLACK